MKNIIGVLLIIFISTLFCSCCDKKELGRVNFQQSDLHVNPYIGNETLSFTDNNNTIIDYKANYRKITTLQSNGCADCCQDYYTVQSSDNTDFSSGFMNSMIAVNLALNYDDITHSTNPKLSFSWSDVPLELSILNIGFTSFPINALKDSAVKWNLYNENMILRDKSFNKVYIAIGDYNGDRLHPDSLFYTISEGIVGIKFSDGNLLVKH